MVSPFNTFSLQRPFYLTGLSCAKWTMSLLRRSVTLAKQKKTGSVQQVVASFLTWTLTQPVIIWFLHVFLLHIIFFVVIQQTYFFDPNFIKFLVWKPPVSLWWAYRLHLRLFHGLCDAAAASCPGDGKQYEVQWVDERSDVKRQCFLQETKRWSLKSLTFQIQVWHFNSRIQMDSRHIADRLPLFSGEPFVCCGFSQEVALIFANEDNGNIAWGVAVPKKLWPVNGDHLTRRRCDLLASK